MDNIYVYNMIHRYHMGHKVKRWASNFDITLQNTVRKDRLSKDKASSCLQPLRINFEDGIKTVKNSYW